MPSDNRPLPTSASEHDHQVALFRWAELASRSTPELELLAAVPNGGLRHPAVARKLKAEGVKAGYPDIVLDVPRFPHHGLRIELKAGSGTATASQRRWIERLAGQGYRALVCRGWDEARQAIVDYLALPRWSGVPQ